MPSLALGTNSSNLTAIGNDFGFEYIFSREFEAIVQKNDILIALTTSGNSQNIVNLILKAKELGIKFFIFTGSDLGKIADLIRTYVNEKNPQKLSVVITGNKYLAFLRIFR